MADPQKLVTKWNTEAEEITDGLTEQPKHWLTRDANLSLRSKLRPESPGMREGLDQKEAPVDDHC